MVPTHLKNIRQIGSFQGFGVKLKNVSHHGPERCWHNFHRVAMPSPGRSTMNPVNNPPFGAKRTVQKTATSPTSQVFQIKGMVPIPPKLPNQRLHPCNLVKFFHRKKRGSASRSFNRGLTEVWGFSPTKSWHK